MKKFFLVIGSLVSLSSIAQSISPVMNLEAGYVSDKYFQFSTSAGAESKLNENISFTLDVGGKFQLTNDKVTDVAGITAGIMLTKGNFFTGIKAGPAIGFNRQVKDELKTDSGVILLSDGYDKSYFFTSMIEAKAGVIINGTPMFIDVSYSGKLFWVGIGVKILFNE